MAIGDYDRDAEIARIKKDWAENPRWRGVARTYSAEDVVRLRGSLKRENTIAKHGAEKLWDLVVNGAKGLHLCGPPAGSGHRPFRRHDHCDSGWQVFRNRVDGFY